MNNFLKKLQKTYNNRYQNYFPTQNFINYREKMLNGFFKKKIIIKKIEKVKLDKKSFNILYFLQKQLYKKIVSKNKKKILFFYKKYSQNLFLKNKYSNNLKKITNKNASLDSYIFLGNIIINLNELNELQKLNFILKINDITLLKYSTKYNHLIKNIITNINYERKITNRYAKKFFSYIS